MSILCRINPLAKVLPYQNCSTYAHLDCRLSVLQEAGILVLQNLSAFRLYFVFYMFRFIHLLVLQSFSFASNLKQKFNDISIFRYKNLFLQNVKPYINVILFFLNLEKKLNWKWQCQALWMKLFLKVQRSALNFTSCLCNSYVIQLTKIVSF